METLAQRKDLYRRVDEGTGGLLQQEPLALGVGAYAIHGSGHGPVLPLALLNSRFMSWYLRERFYERHLREAISR